MRISCCCRARGTPTRPGSHRTSRARRVTRPFMNRNNSEARSWRALKEIRMMRRLGMGVVGAAMLAMPVLTSAQTAVGTFADGCATPVDNHPAGAELYAVKIATAGNTYTNWLWD